MNKDYNIYYFSRAISGIGDALQDIAVITIIAFLTNSAFLSGIIVILNAAVRIICSFFAIKKKSIKNSKLLLVHLNYLYAFVTIVFYILIILKPTILMIKICVITYETLCSLIYTFYKIYQDVIVKEVADTNEKIARLFSTDNIVKIATSFISTVLLLKMSYKEFLLINAISFIISAYLISKLRLDFKGDESQIKKDVGNKIFHNISTFSKQYPSIFKLIILNTILSFFFASYSILFQRIIEIYGIDFKYIGVLNAVYYIISILMSYLSGFLKNENLRQITTIILSIAIIISFLCILNNIFIILLFLLFVYPLIGAGYNTMVQIYFQNKISRDDIPILKGIYNILCGLAILASGILSPILSRKINIFYFSMGILFVISLLYIEYRNKKER